MEHDGFIYPLGFCQMWGGEQPCGIRRADRRNHAWICGKTGGGKSTVMRNLILQDIEAGQGVGLIDPHGDLAEDILDHIPPWRTDHVVYFNPADEEHPIGLNLLQTKEPRHLVASGIVSAFKAIWGDFWGPRLEYILYATVAALLECQNTSLLGVQRMLVDDRYRAWVVKQVKDPLVRSFWLREFAAYDKRFLQEAIAPIQNKVGQLFMAAPIRNILGQVRSRIDARFMMDTGRIFIANLSKGRLGHEKANLLGALLITQFQLAAMARAGVPETDRRDFFLFADEFHNFTTDSFASILSEARKYRLCLTLSNQYITQLRPEIRDAVFGNVGTIIAFRLGYADAEILEREFGHAFHAGEFLDLNRFEVIMKLSLGDRAPVYRGRTLPPIGTRYGRRENIIRRSREKYASSRSEVEDKIGRWMAH